MTTVEEQFDRYRAAYRADESADPRPYLDQLSGTDRRELEALIDGFLATDPGRPYDEAAFARFQADPLTQRISAAVDARMEETWQELLPQAREDARILRSSLVQRLAQALGVGDRTEKVEGYYHEMETGKLTSRDVSGKVLEALSDLVGVPVERLRAAGERLAPPGGQGGAVFARSASPAPAAAPPSMDRVEAAADTGEEPWDEVDELFRGGG